LWWRTSLCINYDSSRFLFRVVCTRSTRITPETPLRLVTTSCILYDLGMLYKWMSASEPTGPSYLSKGCKFARLEGLENADVSREKDTDR